MASKYDDNNQRKIKPVKTPVESTGTCKNVRNCGNHKTYLGNGYCMACWDKGLGGGIKILSPQKKKGNNDQRN